MEEWKGALNKNLKSEKMILEAYSFLNKMESRRERIIC